MHDEIRSEFVERFVQLPVAHAVFIWRKVFRIVSHLLTIVIEVGPHES